MACLRHRRQHRDARRSPSGRFITADRKPVTEPMVGWRNAAIMAGHWVLHGFGLFVVEEKSSGKFVGRVGPFYPPVWPGFEVGWGIASEFRGKGYAVEAARAAINWSFATFELEEIVHSYRSRRTAPRKRWRGGSAPARKARRFCSVTPRSLGHAPHKWAELDCSD